MRCPVSLMGLVSLTLAYLAPCPRFQSGQPHLSATHPLRRLRLRTTACIGNALAEPLGESHEIFYKVDDSRTKFALRNHRFYFLYNNTGDPERSSINN